MGHTYRHKITAMVGSINKSRVVSVLLLHSKFDPILVRCFWSAMMQVGTKFIVYIGFRSCNVSSIVSYFKSSNSIGLCAAGPFL